jgi:hypothetical protein
VSALQGVNSMGPIILIFSNFQSCMQSQQSYLQSHPVFGP